MSVEWTDEGDDTFYATMGNFALAVWNSGSKEEVDWPWHYEVDLPAPGGKSFHFYHGHHQTLEDAQFAAEERAREVAKAARIEEETK